MVQALIFDFDGLILDTEGPEFQAWQEIYTAHGCELRLEVWAQGIGTAADTFNPYDHLETLYRQPLLRDALRQQCHQRSAELIEQQAVLPGVKDYLLEARRLGLKTGLASSSSHAWVEGHLGRLGLLPQFDCIKCSDDVAQVKPDPALYLAVLTELNVPPQQAIAFEDSPNGILAAKRAGIFCVAVPNALTAQLVLDRSDRRLFSMVELPLEQLLQTV